MKRAVEFLRSVLPADLTQLLFLTGVICLTIAARLRWLPIGFNGLPADQHAQLLFGQARATISFALWLIVFSGVSGYFVCFRPGGHPLRRILGLVVLPAVAGLGLVFSQVLTVVRLPVSVLEHTSHFDVRASWRLWFQGGTPPGILFCVVGLLLITIYVSKMVFGLSRLPLSLPGTSCSEINSESWRHLQFLIWILVGPLFILYSAFAFLALVLSSIHTSGLPQYAGSVLFSTFLPVLEGSFVFAMLLWIMGKENRGIIWKAFGQPKLRQIGLGFALPVGIASTLTMGQYLLDRAFWAAHNIGRFFPPQFRSYFDLPDPWLLLNFFPALYEEMIFRGLLQRRFIQRYGIYRGIFLVGVVWAAFHFSSDFSSVRSSATDAAWQVCWRVFSCEALSYVLGWLTLRFGTILPAAVAHTLYNVLVFSGFGPPFQGKSTTLVALWAILGCVLFYYWPIQEQLGQEPDTLGVNPEGAVEEGT